MEAFTRLCGIAAPLLLANVNTDAMAPSHWGRDHPNNLGPGLFRDWRFDKSGAEVADFPLNNPRYRAARILLGGPNFGCGSARETAVWAAVGYGIRCVIAPSFGDVFRDNAFQNGLLCIDRPLRQVEALAAMVEAMDDPVLCIDLAAGTIEAGGRVIDGFSVPADRRAALLAGLDETMLLRGKEPAIAAFQAADAERRPWIYAGAVPGG